MTTDELKKKMDEMKATHAAAMAELVAKEAELKAQMKQLEADQKKAKEESMGLVEAEKMRKFAELVAAGKIEIKENKKETVLWCMINGYCKDAILAYTGYTVKEVTDITWQIFESNGCNPDRK